MNLDGVDVFVKVVQFGGFSAAARQMGMPTTTVSAKIARLEERLGVTLLQRSTRRLRVTAAGEAYYRRCVEAVRLIETGESELAATRATPTGLLRITAAPDTAQTLLPPVIAAYLSRYEGTRVDLVATNRIVDLISEGVDLALRAAVQLQDSTLQVRRFSVGRLILVASPDFLDRHGRPGRLADIRPEHLLVHTRFPREVPFVDPEGKTQLLRPEGRALADDMQALRALALRGVGIAMVPDVVSSRDGLEQVLPGASTVPAPLHLVYPASRHTSPAVRAFIDLALEIWGGDVRPLTA